MSKHVAPLPPRYRNDAVYRSAQRLIASRPAPRRKNVPRPLVFIVGAICGALVTLLVVYRATAPRTLSPVSKVSAQRPSPAASVPPAGGSAPTTTRPAPPPALPGIATAEPAPSVAPVESAPVSVEARPTPTPRAVQAWRPSPTAPRPSGIRDPDPVPIMTFVSYDTDLVLHGEMLAAPDPPLKVAVFLRRTPKSGPATVSGFVRLTARDRVQVIFVQGTIQPATGEVRQIDLREFQLRSAGVTTPWNAWAFQLSRGMAGRDWHGTSSHQVSHGVLSLRQSLDP